MCHQSLLFITIHICYISSRDAILHITNFLWCIYQRLISLYDTALHSHDFSQQSHYDIPSLGTTLTLIANLHLIYNSISFCFLRTSYPYQLVASHLNFKCSHCKKVSHGLDHMAHPFNILQCATISQLFRNFGTVLSSAFIHTLPSQFWRTFYHDEAYQFPSNFIFCQN